MCGGCCDRVQTARATSSARQRLVEVVAEALGLDHPGRDQRVRTPVPLKSCRAASAIPVTANLVAQ